MVAVRVLCFVAGLACASAVLDARGQAALKQYVPPQPSSDQGQSSDQRQSSDQSQSSNDSPNDAIDDRYVSPSDQYDHSLPSSPYHAPQGAAARAPQAYVPPPPPDPIDVARANCATLHQRLEAVMRAEMRGGNPAAMKQHAAERAAIYQQEMQIGCR